MDDWSPRKKKGGYLPTGMAARAAAVLAAARTEQTLWLHDMSRLVSSAGALPRPQLAHALQPAVRLAVVTVLSFGSDAADTLVVGGRDRRRDRRTLLAQCRLLLPAEGSGRDDGAPSEQRDLNGLVLFSLHERPASASAVPGAPSPSKRPAKANASGAGGTPGPPPPASVVVPAAPADLRFLRPGAEVWVWEPFREVVLAQRAETWCIAAPSPPSSAPADAPSVDDAGAVQVEWEAGLGIGARERAEEEREGDRTTKALVCGKFGVVV
ncbi:hypothetical protein JCM3770_000516 [Rhodotorula araucariae]